MSYYHHLEFLYDAFVPEGTHETFDWKQLIGFVILVFGSLMYNEIVVFPCGGFDQNTKEAIKARKKKEEEEGIEHDQIEPTIPVDTSTDKPIEPEKEEAPPVVVNDNNEEKKEEEQTEEHNENQ